MSAHTVHTNGCYKIVETSAHVLESRSAPPFIFSAHPWVHEGKELVQEVLVDLKNQIKNKKVECGIPDIKAKPMLA